MIGQGTYVDYTVLDGSKTDWAVMMMNQDLVEDMRDSFESHIEVLDKRIKNASSAPNNSINQEVLKKLLLQKERIKVMLTLINKELE